MTGFRRRILHVSESDRWSGGAEQLLALARSMRERGWEVWIACRPKSGLLKAATEQDFRTFTVALREDYDIFSARKLVGFIREKDIAVVHAHHNRSHAVCLLAKLIMRMGRGRLPVLVVSRRVSFPAGKNPFSMWKYRSKLIDSYVAVAQAVKEVLIASGVTPARVAVIHSGVDNSRFSPRPPNNALRKGLGLPSDRPVIGKIANASAWKGQTVLLDAASILIKKGIQAHFLLAGRDTDSEWIRDEVKDRGLGSHVTLAGFRSDVPELLSCLSVSVNAAVKGEGLSGALRESLAMGIPVVASDIAGNRELLGEAGKGALFSPGDSHDLADRLAWVLRHPEAARKQAQTWRSTAGREFSSERTVERTIALYERLAGLEAKT